MKFESIFKYLFQQHALETVNWQMRKKGFDSQRTNMPIYRLLFDTESSHLCTRVTEMHPGPLRNIAIRFNNVTPLYWKHWMFYISSAVNDDWMFDTNNLFSEKDCWQIDKHIKNDESITITNQITPSDYQHTWIIGYITLYILTYKIPGPLFTKRQDVLPTNLVKSRSHEIECYNSRIALKFDRHLGSSAVDVPVKFQSDWQSPNPNLAASRLHEILQ